MVNHRYILLKINSAQSILEHDLPGGFFELIIFMTDLEKSAKKNTALAYFQESYQELKKVTWPTRNQAVKMTFLVLGFCLVSAVVIGVLDFAFSSGHEFLLNNAPVAPIESTEPAIQAVNEAGETVPLTITEGGEVTPQ